MNILSIGTDREICKTGSDVQSRMMLYGPLVTELHLHCTIKNHAGKEKIAENIWIHPVTSWMKSISLCSKLIKKYKIDVIVSPDPFAKACFAMILAFVFRKKLLLSVYGGNIFDKNWKKLSVFNKIYSVIGRIIFKYADAIQTDGLETYDELKEKYGAKVFWKPMVPANIEAFLAIEKDSHLNIELKESDNFTKNKVSVLYVGRLIEQKNIPFLARVVREIRDKKLNETSFTIVGDGPLKHMLDGLDVKILSKLNREEIVERFRESDMLILTSYFEGFARVVMEAGLAGIPVVTTRVSGIQGIVENNVSGYVLEQGDEKGFIESVQELISNKNKRNEMGKAIREKAKSMLSIDMMIKKQKEVYDYLDIKQK
jgi:glycosyltransferase involved in cell wall biosynthesis